jgi:RNA polymerase sigma-54 factor
MALEFKLQQKLSQNLVMTPQLQQAIKLLQLGHQEYAEVIENELLENPALEEMPSEDNKDKVEDKDHSEISFSDNIEESDFKIRGQEKGEEFEFNGQFYETARKGGMPEDAISALEGSISVPEGLSSHLLFQLQTSDIPQEFKPIALYIIGNLDYNGLLNIELYDIAKDCEVTMEEVETVLGLVQALDPPGVASRSLKECLLIQLDAIGLRGSLSYTIVEEYLKELELKNYDLISKRTGHTKEEVYSAIRIIQKLEPRPGRNFSQEPPQYISPDVYIKRVGSDYVIALNDSGIPKLKISSDFSDLLKKSSNPLGAEKEYFVEKVKSAQWLIKSILQRQQTIYKVTESIMKFQRDFLENGVSGLKPLVLREIAADVELHESTISRVTSNKYVHTPHGVYELKFFFSSGLSSGGGDVSSEAVKNRIKDLVAKEEPKKPLSDQQLVAQLQSEGVEIARRTVAKYREMMGILSSSRRKKVF